MNKGIRFEHWSDFCGEWQFYSYFDSKEDMDKHITAKGFDPKFFREAL